MATKRDSGFRIVRMKWINIIFCAIAVILTAVMLFGILQTGKQVEALQTAAGGIEAIRTLLTRQTILILLFLLAALCYAILAHSYYQMSERHREGLSHEANHDPLTGAMNRRAYERELRAEEEASLALILIDVDNLRHFNNEYGHETGDKVLRKVVRVLREHFRSEDHIFRIGGDEFVVLMKHVNSGLRQLIANKMAGVAADLRNGEDGVPVITLSVGVAFGDDLPASGSLFRCADQAQYTVKTASKDGCSFYDGPAAGYRQKSDS